MEESWNETIERLLGEYGTVFIGAARNFGYETVNGPEGLERVEIAFSRDSQYDPPIRLIVAELTRYTEDKS